MRIEDARRQCDPGRRQAIISRIGDGDGERRGLWSRDRRSGRDRGSHGGGQCGEQVGSTEQALLLGDHCRPPARPCHRMDACGRRSLFRTRVNSLPATNPAMDGSAILTALSPKGVGVVQTLIGVMASTFSLIRAQPSMIRSVLEPSRPDSPSPGPSWNPVRVTHYFARWRRIA